MRRHPLTNRNALLGGMANVVPFAGAPLIANEGESAKLLGLSRRTLQRMRLEGNGPAFVQLTPSGSRIGYRLVDFDSWLRARLVTSTSAATVAARQAAE